MEVRWGKPPDYRQDALLHERHLFDLAWRKPVINAARLPVWVFCAGPCSPSPTDGPDRLQGYVPALDARDALRDAQSVGIKKFGGVVVRSRASVCGFRSFGTEAGSKRNDSNAGPSGSNILEICLTRRPIRVEIGSRLPSTIQHRVGWNWRQTRRMPTNKKSHERIYLLLPALPSRHCL